MATMQARSSRGSNLDIPVEHMTERTKIAGVRGDKPQQQLGNANPRQLAVERAVDWLLRFGILQPPATLLGPGDLNVGVQARSDTVIDGGELGIQTCMERLQRVLNRGQQQGAPISRNTASLSCHRASLIKSSSKRRNSVLSPTKTFPASNVADQAIHQEFVPIHVHSPRFPSALVKR